MADKPTCVVVGVGPGNGLALVRKYAAEGYAVAALARSEDKLEALTEGIEGVTPYACDAGDAAQVEEVYGRITSELGPVHTLAYNAGSGTFGDFEQVNADQLELSWRVNTLGLFLAAKQVIPAMRARNEGVIGIVGATASLRGKPFTTVFAQAKAAQRSLAQSLARQYGKEGIHVFYVILDGMVNLERTRKQMPDKPDEFFLNPSDLADVMYATGTQARSAWTFELDVRPFGENW